MNPIDVVAVIPARGGSKGVPGKNLALVGGRSLVGRAIRSCHDAGTVDLVVVSTDDVSIATEAKRWGASVIDRPAELSGDEATSESAVLHVLDRLAAEGIEPRVVAFLQCTSPFIAPSALAHAVQRVSSGDADCVFAACETYDFLWGVAPDGAAVGRNHDPASRPRRQDRVADWNETGAFYVMSRAGFRGAGHRFFGRVEIEAVPFTESIEIDTPEDLEVARALVGSMSRPGLRLGSVTALVTDFDGVHTDDRAFVDQYGNETVRVNRSDGHGVKLLREAGVPVLVLSTETNPVVARRAAKLQIECLHGIDDKAAALREWIAAHGLDAGSVVYLGNDVNDIGCLEIVGHPVAVADAHPRVLAVASQVTIARGGAGAVREVAESILASIDPAG